MGTGMNLRIHLATSKIWSQLSWTAAALLVASPLVLSQAQADEAYPGPNFRKGLWHFVQTLDVVRSSYKNIKYRLLRRETTRCVDPTSAMKATFASTSVGTCVSDKPEKVDNKYTFAHRCDYMGAVSTVITVNSEEAYTEINELSTGDHPRTDKVIARRVGDCQDDTAQSAGPASVSTIEH